MFKYLVSFFEILFIQAPKHNRFSHDMKTEIQRVCQLLNDIVKFIKVHVTVTLWNNSKVHTILANICGNAVPKLQKYLVHVDY